VIRPGGSVRSAVINSASHVPSRAVIIDEFQPSSVPGGTVNAANGCGTRDSKSIHRQERQLTTPARRGSD